MTGSVLDKYEVLQKVGEGGMATVYLGRHATLGREVAIKVLHPHLSASERNRQRFAREARAIEHLDHDNILKIYDYSGTDVSDCYIVTEFVRGRTLQDLIQSRGLVPSEVAAIIALPLAHALEYAHGAGIVHRDLKPENVMIREDGAVKLMDFGIARFIDESTVTMTGALVGSPAYMSPEQALEGAVDSRSDLFSLGTLLFQLVTGSLPFTGTNPSIILRNIIEGKRAEVLEVMPAAAPRLADLIERLLQTDLHARPDSARQARERLEEVLSDAEIDLRDTSWSLKSFLDAPEAYETRLRGHLSEVLLRKGKAAFASGDHLGAQRLFNRILASDPENTEVLALLSSFHGGETVLPGRPAESSGSRLVAGSVAVLCLAAIAWWVLRPEPPPVEASAPQAAVAAPAPVVPTEAAPAPVPDAPTPPAIAPTGPPAVSPIDRPRGARPAAGASAPLAVEEAPARVTVRFVRGSGPSWGQVELDGKFAGDAHQPLNLELEPGAHVLRVTNPLAREWRESFNVAAGESRVFEINLVPLPTTVEIRGFAQDCVVLVDGVEAGAVGGLGGRLVLEDVSGSPTVRVVCPEGQTGSLKLGAAQAGRTVELQP